MVLAAGDSATVALPNGQGIQVALTNATAQALVDNSGTIRAENGTVLLTARGKDTLLSTVVNLSGVVRAGDVVLDAGTTGDVAMTGKIDASNTAPGGTGGTVVLSGDRVGLFNNASIDVSGDAAGGKVILGGDSLHQLTGTQAQTMLADGMTFANDTQVDRGATIRADSAHGDGGFVETSGHDLDVQGAVSASAPNGKSGQWLIDPTNVTIATSSDAGYGGSVTSGFSGGSNASATINNTTISDALNEGTDVLISTASTGSASGDIVQNAGADIRKTAGGAANLTMTANGSIQLNGNITSTSDTLDLNLVAGVGTANGSVNNNTDGTSTIDLNGGNLTIWGRTTSGNGILRNGNSIALSGSVVNIGGGSLQGTSSGGAGVVFQGTLTTTGNGTLTATGVSNSGNGVVIWKYGNLNVTGNSTIEINGTSASGRSVYAFAGYDSVNGRAADRRGQCVRQQFDDFHRSLDGEHGCQSARTNQRRGRQHGRDSRRFVPRHGRRPERRDQRFRDGRSGGFRKLHRSRRSRAIRHHQCHGQRHCDRQRELDARHRRNDHRGRQRHASGCRVDQKQRAIDRL
ncbi:hypothetical protein D7S86_16970 [Pararobbsia silviterrae]|uniref:Uncharacterized protein n=1 Tax=Pararobbsia silviterrae TaxID=1792498 RepID=A0A494Y0M3_9BURK|nr:hypothetical protein D7S86_16970 [Pararobbsia silviterrae]